MLQAAWRSKEVNEAGVDMRVQSTAGGAKACNQISDNTSKNQAAEACPKIRVLYGVECESAYGGSHNPTHSPSHSINVPTPFVNLVLIDLVHDIISRFFLPNAGAETHAVLSASILKRLVRLII